VRSPESTVKPGDFCGIILVLRNIYAIRTANDRGSTMKPAIWSHSYNNRLNRLWNFFAGSFRFFTSHLSGVLLLAGALLAIALSIIIWIFYSLKSKYGFVIGVSLFILGATFLTRGLIRDVEQTRVEKDTSVKYPQTDFENYE